MEKELYWILGSEENPKGVKNALRNVGIIVRPWMLCNIDERIIYGCKGKSADYAIVDSSTAEIIMACGTELQPLPEEKEAEEDEMDKLKPFDRVVARIKPFRGQNTTWKGDIFLGKSKSAGGKRIVHLAYHCTGVCNNDGTDNDELEVHKYEEWMAPYIGTETPFCEWEKPDGKSNQ